MTRTAPQRKLEILASNVLFVGLAFAIADSLRVVLAGRIQQPLTLAMLVLGWLLFAAYYYALRRGVTVLKWLFVLGQGGTLLYSLYHYQTVLLPVLHSSFWTVLTYVLFFGSRLVGMGLLIPTLLPRRTQPDLAYGAGAAGTGSDPTARSRSTEVL
jgi:hypothetical protein